MPSQPRVEFNAVRSHQESRLVIVTLAASAIRIGPLLLKTLHVRNCSDPVSPHVSFGRKWCPILTNVGPMLADLGPESGPILAESAPGQIWAEF